MHTISGYVQHALSDRGSQAAGQVVPPLAQSTGQMMRKMVVRRR